MGVVVLVLGRVGLLFFTQAPCEEEPRFSPTLLPLLPYPAGSLLRTHRTRFGGSMSAGRVLKHAEGASHPFRVSKRKAEQKYNREYTTRHFAIQNTR